MKAKEYLSQIPNIHTKIQNMKERIERLRSILESPGVQELTPDRVQTSMASDKMEKMVTEKERLEDELQSLMYEAAVLIIRIGKQIDQLGVAEYARVLHLRYEEGMKWRKIAEIMHYSYDYVKRDLHGNALEAFRVKYMEILDSV